MGLDMYLSARVSLNTWNKRNGEQNVLKIQNILTQLDLPKGIVDSDDSLSVVIPVAYWRKANAIHNWFVEHVQDGEDNCRPYDVEPEQLRELQNLCKVVLDARGDAEIAEATASSYLPPSTGFFFGSDELDDWYYNKLQYTYDKLEELLAIPALVEFTYQSSW
jgi:hypothetical protein